MAHKLAFPLVPSADDGEGRCLVQYVKLNVGGSLFHTTVGTLVKYDSMFRAMFSGRLDVMTDSDGFVLIDRSGKHFPVILNFLRDGAIPLPDSLHEVREILAEAKYYLLQELIELCQEWIRAFTAANDDMALISMRRVPTVSTRKEAEQVIAATRKPLIKLLLNRHNNKYSYTPMSDDNLMKNLELFDRLVVKFSERALFVKDTGADSPEICQWTFYESGVNKAEISCCSIVYAPEKKTIKVEFPEARIYEEAMHAVVLYERNNCWRCGAPTISCAGQPPAAQVSCSSAPSANSESIPSPVSSASVRFYAANDLLTAQTSSSSTLSPPSAFASLSIKDRPSSSSTVPDAPGPRIAVARPNRLTPFDPTEKLSD
uniref:BTB domain-containing protein n=1 Tax=Steinernema glaseri TaxID=37863 RepID=A0A1I8AF14_9BILA